MHIQIGCIVEGYGEVDAVPILIRRIAERILPGSYVHIPRPLRTSRSTLVKVGELERAVAFVANQIAGQGAILTLIDADDDCPASLGPSLLERAIQARSDVPHAVVLAKFEYEAWFLAATESLGGKRGLPANLPIPANPEGKRGAKEWLSKHISGSSTYSEVVDQPALTSLFDMDRARRADSFDKCYREIERLLLPLSQQG